jgi:hypothetical protein
MPYEELDFSHQWGKSIPTVTHVGVPFARIAIRRLHAAPSEPTQSDAERCRKLVADAVDRELGARDGSTPVDGPARLTEGRTR